MKKCLFFITPFLLLTLLLSCTQNHIHQIEEETSNYSIVIYVSNFASPLRTIAPDALDVGILSNTTKYRFTIQGVSGYRTLAEQDISLSGGTAVLGNIPQGTWQLTLTAYDKTTNQQLLKGVSVVNVESVNTPVEFTLSTRGVTGTGTISVKFTLNTIDYNLLRTGTSTITVALYPQNSTTAISGTEQSFTTTSSTLLQTVTYTAGGMPIASGAFNLGISIESDKLPQDYPFAWKDLTYIEPGRETTDTISLPQLIFMPEAPTNLSSTPLVLSSDGTKYTSTLSWQCVYNHDAHELELMENNTPIYTDTAWETAQTAGNTVTRFSGVVGNTDTYTNILGIPGWDGSTGGLEKGKHEIGLNLEIGKTYTWRMRTVNIFGESDWVYCTTLLEVTP